MAKRSRQAQVTRFAPSPTGYLHVGHVFSAFTAYHARGKGGTFHVRIEDIDQARCKDKYIDAILEDLNWLGLDWETPVRKQSRHMLDYDKALKKLDFKDLLYPCFCSRSDIMAEIERSGHAPHGPGGPVYPETCKKLSNTTRDCFIGKGKAHVQRLNTKAALAITGPLEWYEINQGLVKANPAQFGDVVLARRESRTSYHLAVAVDDHLQGVTIVNRGADLALSTDVHRLLQALLGFPSPSYDHHRLVKDVNGQRLAKRDQSLTVRSLRDRGWSPIEVINMSGFAKSF
ncbi:MAG: tRNA glutamyl-Q(34) synthetase GluQRS [Pseudomonadota bacterium]|nr:tRNA glutamyl-Q(34) synthetase GluQRS [Pseudomonadota bacterium]